MINLKKIKHVIVIKLIVLTKFLLLHLFIDFRNEIENNLATLSKSLEKPGIIEII